MKIYTKTGDKGQTGLFGGGRVSKAHPRVNAYGSVDELNSVLGMVIGLEKDAASRDRLQAVQEHLFRVGAELAATAEKRHSLGIPLIGEDEVQLLERYIDEVDARLETLRNFILPGGSQLASWLHIARTVTRRVEREVVSAASFDEEYEDIVRYLNRLSDLLFVLARDANQRAEVQDIIWTGAKRESA